MKCIYSEKSFTDIIHLFPFTRSMEYFQNFLKILKRISVTSGTVSCATQDTLFGKAFVSWLIVLFIIRFILGILLDKFGIWLIKIISSIYFFGGTLCFVFKLVLFITGSLLAISTHDMSFSYISISMLFRGKVICLC